MSETPKNKKSGPVFGYLAIMFAAAFLMLLLAFFIQQRNNEVAMDGLKDSITSFESLDELLEENRELREELDALERELEALKEKNEALEEQISESESKYSQLEQAYQDAQTSGEVAQANLLSWSVFWDAEQLYRTEQYEACSEVVRSWGVSTFYTTPEAAKERAKEIFDHMVSLDLITAEDLVWSLFN